MKAIKGKADMKSSWQNSGRFKITVDTKPTGSIMDTARPATTSQIGPQSKTGFGLNRKA
jgi:hypothetical protein